MYRQAARMDQFDLSVKTNAHLNEGEFPAKNFSVDPIEGKRRLFRTTALRYAQQNWFASRNQAIPGFAKTSAETDWWVSQIQRRRPDVLLAHYGTTAVEMAPLGRHFQIPIVAHFNGVDGSKVLARRRYCRQLVESIDVIKRFVVVADYMRQNLLKIGIPDRQIVKIPYGVPPLDPPSRGDSIRPCEFIAVGRLVAKKRPDLTIRAFATAIERLRKDGWSTPRLPRLTIIGNGLMRRRCKSLLTRYDVASQVEMTGVLAAEETQKRLASADVFVQHSVTARNGDREGWPVAIAEASSWGLPIIATRHASIPEQVIDGQTGLLCDENDWQTMAEHIYRLAIDRELRLQMGTSSAAHLKSMSVDAQVGILQRTLNDAITEESMEEIHSPNFSTSYSPLCYEAA